MLLIKACEYVIGKQICNDSATSNLSFYFDSHKEEAFHTYDITYSPLYHSKTVKNKKRNDDIVLVTLSSPITSGAKWCFF